MARFARRSGQVGELPIILWLAIMGAGEPRSVVALSQVTEHIGGIHMRPLMAGLAWLAVPAALSAQAVPIRFSFDAAPAAVGDAGTVIARRQQMRAWQDTVQVYLEQGAGQANLRLAGPNDTATYRVSVAPLAINKPGANGVAMAVVIFEGAGASDWKYVAHYVAYNESARDAAVALLSQTVQSISAARSRAR